MRRRLLLRQLLGVGDEKLCLVVVLGRDVTKLGDRWCHLDLHLLGLLEHLYLAYSLLLEDWSITLVRLCGLGRLKDVSAIEDKVGASEAVTYGHLCLRHHYLLVEADALPLSFDNELALIVFKSCTILLVLVRI